MIVNSLDIERKLVEQFRQGNEMAFELIFHKTKGKVKGFLTKVLPAGEDAESILQEIYLKLWSNRKSVKADKNFETYLFAIARNMVVDVMRKRFHKQKYLENLYNQLKEGSNNSMDTLANVEYSELERQIFYLIEQLPEQRQIIFKLNRINGLTYKEVAAELNISENTVDMQMRKALFFLRTEVKHFLTLLILAQL
ncbi:RNA polymerase sigma-70 factor [Mariniphaga sediminis]|uniref:RNA polymerase sigma-70 factor n=1 Tax=Mariniphaga sediminis TaxID=1628158 RepID=A0A399CZL0_9BACT|nr:RNA polymerase sigma-70 factor [Mariniphaga sediminis]RIH64368.1 RNA polymerase sigma-70 factor [Mariniphaga sediminis]